MAKLQRLDCKKKSEGVKGVEKSSRVWQNKRKEIEGKNVAWSQISKLQTLNNLELN
jgi:hypothetical protein